MGPTADVIPTRTAIALQALVKSLVLSPAGRFNSEVSSTGSSPVTTRSALLLLILLVMLASGFGQQDQRLEFDALLTAARQAQSMNNYASAADFYKKAVKIQGDLPELWTNLGLMEHETGDYDEAIESFRQANRLKPSLYAPILFLGIDYVRANRQARRSRSC